MIMGIVRAGEAHAIINLILNIFSHIHTQMMMMIQREGERESTLEQNKKKTLVTFH